LSFSCVLRPSVSVSISSNLILYLCISFLKLVLSFDNFLLINPRVLGDILAKLEGFLIFFNFFSVAEIFSFNSFISLFRDVSAVSAPVNSASILINILSNFLSNKLVGGTIFLTSFVHSSNKESNNITDTNKQKVKTLRL